MEGLKVEPESKQCVIIFSSDIVGYTELGGSMGPHLVMNMLDRLYTKFDVLSEKYDLFKVETIGDAYMAVVNLHKDAQVDAWFSSTLEMN
jgi:class 3 adenylate cyclase